MGKQTKRAEVKARLFSSKLSTVALLFFSFLTNNLVARQIRYKVTFDGAADLALRHRKDLRAFEYARRASRYAERTALAPALPQVSATGRFARAGTRVSARKSGTISATQLLYTAGGPILDYRIAKQGTKIVESQRDEFANAVRFGAESSCLALQQKLLEEKFVATTNTTSKSVFEQQSGKRNVGLISGSDWRQAAAQYAQAQATVFNYPSDLDSAVVKLQRETGVMVQQDQIDLSLEGIAGLELKPRAWYQRQARLRRPELKTKRHLIKQTRLSEKRYARNYVPEVYLFGEASGQELNECIATNCNNRTHEYLPVRQFSAGVQFSWSFDGFASAHESRRYASHKIEFILQERDLVLQIERDVTTAYNTVDKNLNDLKASRFALEAAQSRVQTNRQKYKVGTISEADLAQTKQKYQEALFAFRSQSIGVRTAYQNLLFVCGYPQKG